MPSRRIKPPPVPGTWAWLYREIRARVSRDGLYRASDEAAFGWLRRNGERRVEERLAEWCAARRLVLRIDGDQVEVRPVPKTGKPAVSVQDVIVRSLF